ncbi:YhcH/YjgK/YiaL family protein [uncultured Croceitalea sp.]|uniref:YhcH/YjgK/YiaL family protein n=1 Tax=uncultured Croceitalea sp. TaxID=1798908 RepID=UPI0033066B6C
MIFDNISNWRNYFDCFNGFDKIFEKLETITMETANGHYKINDMCYYKVMSYKTMLNPSVIESHKKEVDLQILFSGKERIKIFSRSKVEPMGIYDEKTDCQFYKATESPDLELVLAPGKMALFFPQDIHGCQHIVNENSKDLKKVVFKINEKLFTLKK